MILSTKHARLLLGVGFALLLGMRMQAQTTFLTNGLVAYYPFDAGLESTVSAAPINWSADPTFRQDRFGRIKSALYLDGASYGLIQNQAATSMSGEFTTTLWALTYPNSPRNGRILSVAYPSGYEIGRCTDCGTTYFEPLLIFKSVDFGHDLPKVVDLPESRWVMFVLRYKDGVGSFWVDGKKVFTFSSSPPSGGVMNIGQRSEGGVGKFLGLVDDLRFYNRALSDAEVAALYEYESTPPDNSYITNGLVAFYPFTGNANDESGNEKHGTPINLTFGTDRFGESGKAGSFNGSSAYVALPEIDSDLGAPKGSFTISVWVESPARVGNNHIIAATDSNPYQMPRLDVQATRKVGYYLREGGTGYEGSGAVDVDTDWNHIVYVVNGQTGSGRVFINGVEDTAFRFSYDENRDYRNANRVWAIGNTLNTTCGGCNPFYNGGIDDLRIYNRALSAAEVSDLYVDEAPTPTPSVTLTLPSTPVGGWVAPARLTLGATVEAPGTSVAKVQFLADGQVLGEDASAPYTWSWTGVTAGTRTLVARVVYGGNKTVDSAGTSLTVRAPIPVVALRLPTTPPGGWLEPADVTLKATVDTRGNSVTKVQFLADGEVLGEDASVPYSWSWMRVTEGTRTLVARVVYGGGDTVDSAETTLVVRKPAPLVALTVSTAPAGGWIAPATLTLNASVEAKGNTVAKVQFVADGEVIGEDVSAPYSWSWTGVTSGNWAVVARVVYGSDRTVQSAERKVVVANPPPTIGLTVPTAPTGGWMEPASLTLTASVVTQGNTIQKVQFLADGGLLGEDTSPPYAFTWTRVTAGTRLVSARVVYGVASMVSTEPVSVVVSRSPPPTITLTLPGTPAGGWIEPASLTLTASVVAQGNVIQKVQFLANGSLLGEDASVPYTHTLTDAKAGSRTLVARLFYGGGKTADSTPVTLTVARGPTPTVELILPTAPAGGWVAPANLTLAATVDARGNAIQKVQFVANGTVIGEDKTPPYTWNWNKVTSGVRTLLARVVYAPNKTADSTPAQVTIQPQLPYPGRIESYPTAPQAPEAPEDSWHREDSRNYPWVKLHGSADGSATELWIFAAAGEPLILESSTGCLEWSAVQKLSGRGFDNPVRLPFPVGRMAGTRVEAEFWRIRSQ